MLKNSKVKTHGLAVTGKYLCEKYPFYSVDSISWSAPAVYGRVNVWKNFKIETLTKEKLLRIDNECTLFKWNYEIFFKGRL